MPDVHTKTVRVRISGRVQGVWFRGWTREIAESLQLNGWVRNRRDGTVEALFSGEVGAVDDMLRRCESGPPAAQVVQMDSQALDEEPISTGFRIRTTY